MREKKRKPGRPVKNEIEPLDIPAEEIAKRLLRPIRKPRKKENG